MALYGSQYRGVRGARPRQLMPDQVAALNTQLQYLPERMAQQQAEQQHQETMDYNYKSLAQAQNIFNKNYALQKKTAEQAQNQAQATMGLSAGTLGLNAAMSGAGSTTLADKYPGTFAGKFDASADAKQLNKSIYSTTSGVSGNTTPGTTGILSSAKAVLGNLSLGNTIGAGLMGFGASNIAKGLGVKNKFLGSAIGAGIGGLSSLFTGGGNSTANVISGSIFGGLGGLL